MKTAAFRGEFQKTENESLLYFALELKADFTPKCLSHLGLPAGINASSHHL